MVSSTKGLGDWTIDFLIQLNNLQLYNQSGLHGLKNYLELVRKSFHFIFFFIRVVHCMHFRVLSHYDKQIYIVMTKWCPIQIRENTTV